MQMNDPMFPGQVFDAADRTAADIAARLDRARADADALTAARATAVDMGWPIALLPENRGGLGMGYEGLATIAEALGRHGGPVALTGTACAVVELAGLLPEAERDRIDAMLAEGRTVAAAFGTMVEERIADGDLRVAAKGDEAEVSGEIVGVDCETLPDAVLVAVPDGDAVLILQVAPGDGAEITPRRRMDTRPAMALRLDGMARLVLARVPAEAVAEVERRAALIMSAEAIGAAFRAMELTVGYMVDREQFGTAISTFQVLRHKIVDVFVAAMVARGAVMEAVLALDADRATAKDLELATLEMRSAAQMIAKEVIQIHGGIGMTDQLPAALLARRLLMADYEYGSKARTLAFLAA